MWCEKAHSNEYLCVVVDIEKRVHKLMGFDEVLVEKINGKILCARKRVSFVPNLVFDFFD